MTKLKTKNLKPIELHVNLKYKCPQCCIDHWLSLKETQTKGFIVVCDCGNIFKVRRVETIKVIHHKSFHKSTNKNIDQNTIKSNTNTNLADDLLQSCVQTLTNYGFTKDEASCALKKEFSKTGCTDKLELIKSCLKSIGENNG